MTLAELAERLGVPARQIRFLIAEGILPPAAKTGRAADAYDETHFEKGQRYLIVRELGDALGLSNLASVALTEHRTGANRVHQMSGSFRQAVYGRPAGYEDVIDAERLAHDPVMRQVLDARAITFQLAEGTVTGPMVRAVIAAIQRLRAPPATTC